MRAGSTFVIRFEHAGPQPHLWIQVTEPDAPEAEKDRRFGDLER